MTAPTNTPPSVSVVMSCYNDAQTLPATLRSLQQQTLQDWELIAINDGSTDQTAEILYRAADEDPRISVVHQENTGLTRALIHGCRIANAPYIARHDADDASLPARLAQQSELLANRPEVGFVSCFADYIGPRDEYLSTVTRPADSNEATEKLLNERLGPPAHGTVMFRKSIYEQVGSYRPQFYYAQDSDLWLRMAEVSQIAYMQESAYQFRWHPGSITGSGRSLQSEFGRLGQLCRQARREGTPEQPWLQKAEQLTTSIVEQRQQTQGHAETAAKKNNQLSMGYLIGSQLVRNRDYRARGYLRHVLRHQPWHWKAWVRLAQSLVSSQKRKAQSEEQRSC